MKYFLLSLYMLICIYSDSVYAKQYGTHSRDSITKYNYMLIFINEDTEFATRGEHVKELMEDAFFKVYPEEAVMFNTNASHKVIFVMDPAYDGVAATTGNVVHFNPHYMLGEPTDVDVVTHEVMHIVQAYGDNAGPGWLTEGIADYARYKFGVDNAGANWTMPNYQRGQSYTDSYRITARFLVWLEHKAKLGIVKDLDKSMRNHTYSNTIWQQLTGKPLDELWDAYTKNPSI